MRKGGILHFIVHSHFSKLIVIVSKGPFGLSFIISYNPIEKGRHNEKIHCGYFKII